MHIAHDYNEGSIPVDYERTVVDIMISAVRYFVEFQRTLEFLWQVDWGPKRTIRASSDIQSNTTQDSDAAGEEHIPLWLPRWWDRSDVFLSKSEKLPIGKTMCSRKSLAADNKRLQVQGFCVDTIVWVLGCVNTLPNLTTREFGDIVRHLFYQDVPPQLRSTFCEVFVRYRLPSLFYPNTLTLAGGNMTTLKRRLRATEVSGFSQTATGLLHKTKSNGSTSLSKELLLLPSSFHIRTASPSINPGT